MTRNDRKLYARLLCGAAAVAWATLSNVAAAQAKPIEIAPQSLSSALTEFSAQSQRPVIATSDLTGAKTSRGVSAIADPDAALRRVLEGTGLTFRREGEGFLIIRASAPARAVRVANARAAATFSATEPTGEAAPEAGNIVQELIVTAQKKEEAIQTVPIAISAFTQKTLEEQHIEGGFDLLKAIPNVTFSKNNFSSYNFSIRGIGTKAVSATTDPGVAVAFNNASLIQNRLFEQEYFDVERVEVLRGPQGTLYGRNATAGVINVISAKPDMTEFRGSLKGEVGNYGSKRLSAMLNFPLIEDKLAVRFAGALTKRDGYDYNASTQHAVNGRDLWSARVTVAFNPTERLRTSLVWERFDEDDNRSRTGKQLCKRDPGPDSIGNAPIDPDPAYHDIYKGVVFSQGCSPVSLYDDTAFETPNGFALPFVGGIVAIQGGCLRNALYPIGYPTPGGNAQSLLRCIDPYGGKLQSRDLRVIDSVRDPVYRAKADIVQLNFDFDISNNLSISSQTTYNRDMVYSFQDYNRFNTEPIFQDTSNLYNPYQSSGSPSDPSPWQDLAPGGVFCDPQIGCSDKIAGFDISQAKGKQWLQELRVASNFDGPLNFTVGANYTKFKVVADYYVMYNLLSVLAQTPPFSFTGDPKTCGQGAGFGLNFDPPIPIDDPRAGCPYIDPNPVENIDGEGHNYFRSQNPYRLTSAAAFGEAYWKVAENIKLTLGLRYTDDHKTFTPIPSQLLLGTWLLLGGTLSKGFYAEPDIKQHWGEWTGRLGVDWKPDLGFTDSTMLYGFYSRGYKGGGANPPLIGFAKQSPVGGPPLLDPIAQNTSPTFRPEFVNAFEVGSKNTLLGGAMTFNTSAFFYDYKDYQVSKIVDRSVANENFDATVWGLEFEAVLAPSRNLRIISNLGYLDTRIGKGARSIDTMNRTAGDPNYVLVRPWLQLPSNCIAPKALVEAYLIERAGIPYDYAGICGGAPIGGGAPYDPALNKTYSPLDYPINGGAGIAQDVGGNELPNSPHWTMNIGGQYGVDFLEGWRATVRADAYWQSQSWARVYNAVNDKLHGWYNANLSLWLERPQDGLKIEIYAKNVLDKTPITDAFINSDDTVLTTNVFVLDPRLIGVSITKAF